VLAREAQEAGQLGQGVQQAGDRCGVALVVAVGEGARPPAGLGDRSLAGFGVEVVEDLPERRLDLGLGVLWDLGEQVPGAVDQTPLPQGLWEHQLDRADQPRCAVGDHQQRRPQAPLDQLAQEAGPGVVALVAARCQPDQHRGALAGDAPGGKHRLGPSARVHPKVRAVQEQVLQLDPAELTQLPGVELGLDRLADAADGRLRQCRLRAQRLGQRGLHVAHAQATHEPRHHQRLQRVGPADALAQQPRGERLVGAAQLGPLQHHRPGGGLDVKLGVAVAIADALPVAAGVALPAQELGHLGLNGGLHHQPHAQPGDLLQHLAEFLLGGEQLVDLGADALDSR
jgi:hypothetical protein